MSSSDSNIANVSLRVAIAMFFPALCVVLTRLFTGEGFRGSYLSFNLKNGRYKYYLIAWLIPAVMTLLGILLYFAFFKGDFSPDLKFMTDTYAKQGITGITPEAARKSAVSQALTAIVIGPILNCLTCFGEEWGWRGYLLQKLKGRLKFMPLMMVTGIIWGLWHLPLTVMGHNYGMDYKGYPYLGILAMILFCFTFGTFLSYVTLKTDSCIPAVIGHGAINSIASLGIYFTKDGGRMLFGPSPTGIISGLPLIFLAIILIWLLNNNEEKEK
jgi:membrane protease YdiL (CAAX protease family)